MNDNIKKKKIYCEWLFPVADYLECLRPGERHFEQLIPAICGISSVVICGVFQIALQASRHLNNLLPNVLSILIGFTISSIAIIISSGNGPDQIINKEMNLVVASKKIKFRQWFLVNLIYYTLCEIFFLLLTFVIPLIQKICQNVWIAYLSIFIYVYALMRVLFGIIKIATKLYQVFYRP
jgi:hypothetical protein